MPFAVIAAVLIAFSYEIPPSVGQHSGSQAAVGVIAFLAGNWLLTEFVTRVTARRLRRSWDKRDQILLGYQYLRGLLAAALLGSYAGLIYELDWPAVVAYSFGMDGWVLLDELVVLAPFVVALIGEWLGHFRVEELARTRGQWHDSPLPRWRARCHYIDFQVRQHLGVVLLPLCFLVTLQDVVSLLFRDTDVQPAAELTAGIVGLLIVLALAPVFLRLLWKTTPMPPGPLRSRLEQLSKRLGFRTSDILVWNTRGAVINAAVAGILPWPRYVLFTDALLNHLTPDEIEAVLGHEAGHVRHHHLWFFFAFLLGASTFLVLVGTAARNLLGFAGAQLSEHMLVTAQHLAMPLACLGVYFGLFFGFLSRRFERQADIFGCRAVSCGRADCPDNHCAGPAPIPATPLCPVGIQIFVGALEKIAALSGSVRETRSWRHFSIARRVEFLESLLRSPEQERSFHRVVLVLKFAVIVALVGGLWFVLQSSLASEFEIGR